MAFRRSRGGRRDGRARAKTHWVEGIQFRLSEEFAGQMVQDQTPANLGFAHVVQLTGDTDLFSVGGEAAVIRRIVGNVRCVITEGGGNNAVAPAGARVIQSIQQITVPAGTQAVIAAASSWAAWLLAEQGLSSENILWTRYHTQPILTSGLLGATVIDAHAWGYGPVAATFGNHTNFLGGEYDRSFDIDLSVARRIEHESHLYLVTQWETRQGAVPGTDMDNVRYDGYMRMLMTKGA